MGEYKKIIAIEEVEFKLSYMDEPVKLRKGYWLKFYVPDSERGNYEEMLLSGFVTEVEE